MEGQETVRTPRPEMLSLDAMEYPELSLTVVLAIALLAIHVAGSVLVLRTMRAAGHHVGRLEELSRLKDTLLEKGTRKARAAEPAPATAATAVHLDPAHAGNVVKNLINQQG